MRPEFAYREAIRESEDLERILRLPRRPPVTADSPRAKALIELMSDRLRRPDRPLGSACGCAALGRKRCIDTFQFTQAWALYEAPLAGGLLAPIGVGAGKTLLDVLMAMVMPDCKTAVLFVPPGLVGQLEAEYLAIREHFRVPSIVFPNGAAGYYVAGAPVVHVMPYSRFSRGEATAYLENLCPDLALGDEIHNFKNAGAVRTGRFLRFFADHPETRLCGWSGSITSKSIEDFAHIVAFALGRGSPLPLDPHVVASWATAVDPSDWPAPLGALRRVCVDFGVDDVRAAIHRRLVETRGVVSTTSAGSCDASIYLRERTSAKMPKTLRTMISDVRETWCRPDGEEFVEALEIANCVRQLACGFYYRWRFPGKPSAELVDEWFAARKAYNKERREKLKNPQPHLDSPELLENAAERYRTDYRCGATCAGHDARGRSRCTLAGHLPTWASETWDRWRQVEHKVKHETEVIWVDDYLVRDAAEWAKTHRGVVWYEHTAFGQAVAKLAGVPLHAGGKDAEAKIRAEKGHTSIVAAWKSHGTGRDCLQWVFSEQLVANPPADGALWEQLLGRLHRLGQEADEVWADVYRHVEEFRDPLDRALRYAKYIQGITGNAQKLLVSNVEWGL